MQLFSSAVIVMIVLSSEPSSQQQLHGDDSDSNGNIYAAARQFILEGNTDAIARSADNLVKSVPYFRASIPMRIYECARKYTILHCTKLFVLRKMEERHNFPHSGNLTKDFVDQFFGADDQMDSLMNKNYQQMPEPELNQRLMVNFQRFFQNRDIKLHFLPGIMVKIVPSKENKLKFTLKQTMESKTQFTGRSPKSVEKSDENLSVDESVDPNSDAKRHGNNGGGGGGGGGVGGGGGIRQKKKKRHSYKTTMLQMAVPVMVMPAILMGSFLPFLLPVLKMATIMTLLMNNSAFIAALIYAARTHANSQDEQQHINYGPQGYL